MEKQKKKWWDIGIKEVLSKPITDKKLLRIILLYHCKLSQRIYNKNIKI